MQLKQIFLFTLASLILPLQSGAYNDGEYKYISPKALHNRIQSGDSSIIILDICPVEQFANGHIPGAIETNAYPAQRPEEIARLEAALPKLVGEKDIVVICPGGGSGAKRTIEVYKSKGIDHERLMILENGMNKWPYVTESR